MSLDPLQHLPPQSELIVTRVSHSITWPQLARSRQKFLGARRSQIGACQNGLTEQRIRCIGDYCSYVSEITVRAYRRSLSASKSFSCKEGSFVGPSKSPQNHLAEGRLDKSDSKTDNWQEWQPFGVWTLEKLALRIGKHVLGLPQGGRMMRAELAKVLLDEIKRTRAQLAHLRTVLMMRRKKRTNGLDHCDECETPSEGISESDSSVCSD